MHNVGKKNIKLRSLQNQNNVYNKVNAKHKRNTYHRQRCSKH